MGLLLPKSQTPWDTTCLRLGGGGSAHILFAPAIIITSAFSHTLQNLFFFLQLLFLGRLLAR